MLGRYFRALVPLSSLKAHGLKDTGIGEVLTGCWVGEKALAAPVNHEWFQYRNEQGVVSPQNWTCSDIRWYVGSVLTSRRQEPVHVHIREDMTLLFTADRRFWTPDAIPVVNDPVDEWLIYMAWVNHVRTRSPRAQKQGTIKAGYPSWFRKHFPDKVSPIFLGAPRR